MYLLLAGKQTIEAVFSKFLVDAPVPGLLFILGFDLFLPFFLNYYYFIFSLQIEYFLQPPFSLEQATCSSGTENPKLLFTLMSNKVVKNPQFFKDSRK